MDKVPSIAYSCEEVSEWLKLNGFETFSDKFIEEDVDGEALALLSENALESLVDKVGPRMKLLGVIKKMVRSDSESVESGNSGSLSRLPWDLECPNNSKDQDSPRCSSPIPRNDCSTVRKTWVTPFCLPERFPPAVQEALSKNIALPKLIRVKFIQAIYDKICLFTISPTPDQRRDVCRAIISKYPSLADVGGSYETWYRQLGDKVKNELRHERSDPVVLARKRKSIEGSDLTAKVPGSSRRGIINWEPPAVDGEDLHSNKAHVQWMQKEYRKKHPNMEVVKQKMQLTFSFRRKYINAGKCSLNEIDAKYPFLFEHDQLQDEYERLVSGSSVKDLVVTNLRELAPKILKAASKKKLPQLEELVQACVQNEDELDEENRLTDDEKVVVALCTLPHLLERKTKSNPHPENFLYQTAENPEVLLKKAASPISPFIIFVEDSDGHIMNKMFVAGEKQVCLETDNIFSAVSSLLFCIMFVI
ncbi:uncharacterized protein LOC114537777 [Dendronephthya gigantea]|uniref:uncharacterized protein LOC114537777 n=1 Tax=Dendronephthya gigantea TaxID=151771 RepID=UPI00106CF2AD|nr:uncharacterized protein LOC114537777 [Dendronephthya gigantea]